MVDEMVAFSEAKEDTVSLLGSSNPVTFAVSLYIADYHSEELRHVFTAPSCGVLFFQFFSGSDCFILYKNMNHSLLCVPPNGMDTIGSVKVKLEEYHTVYCKQCKSYHKLRLHLMKSFSMGIFHKWVCMRHMS